MVLVLQELTASPVFSPSLLRAFFVLSSHSLFLQPLWRKDRQPFSMSQAPTNKPIVAADLGPGATVPGSLAMSRISQSCSDSNQGS